MLLYVRENIVLRSLTLSDAAEVYGVVDRNRNHLRKWLPWLDSTNSPAVTEDVIAAWESAYQKKNEIVLGIFEKGVYIGNIGLHRINPTNRSAMIGYWMAEQAGGRGIMTDCVRALTSFGFHGLGLNRITIHCAEGNAKSRAIPERLGFVREGCLQEDECLYGVFHNLILYAMLARNQPQYDGLYLLPPAREHKDATLAYQQEHLDAGEDHIHGSSGMTKAGSYENWREKVIEEQTNPPPGFVPGDLYLAFVNDRIVGTIAVRHSLTKALEETGGHIGYGVRPSERRKGYASKMLALALERCRNLDITKVLITCNKDNEASAKTILRGGGVLENEFVEDDGTIVQRYWIAL